MRAFAPIHACALAAALTAAPHTLRAQQPPAPKPTEAKLVAEEHGAWTGWVTRDTAAYGRDIDRNSVAIDAMGPSVLDLGAVYKAMQTCQLTGHSLDDLKSAQIAPDVVVLSYKASVQGTCEGKPIPSVWASTIYVKRGGKWVAVFHQETPAAPATGA